MHGTRPQTCKGAAGRRKPRLGPVEPHCHRSTLHLADACSRPLGAGTRASLRPLWTLARAFSTEMLRWPGDGSPRSPFGRLRPNGFRFRNTRRHGDGWRRCCPPPRQRDDRVHPRACGACDRRSGRGSTASAERQGHRGKSRRNGRFTTPASRAAASLACHFRKIDGDWWSRGPPLQVPRFSVELSIRYCIYAINCSTASKLFLRVPVCSPTYWGM